MTANAENPLYLEGVEEDLRVDLRTGQTEESARSTLLEQRLLKRGV